MFDWLNAVTARYESLFSLPLRNPAYFEIGNQTANRIGADAAGVSGVLDVATGTVTITAGATATVLVTGVAGGEIYGGQSISKLTVGPTPQNYVVDSHTSS